MSKITSKIIKKLKQRDEEAFRVLFYEFKDTLHYLVMSYVKNRSDAEDIEQEIFIRVLDKIHLYDESKASFSTWFLTLARNYTLNFLKSRSTETNRLVYDEEKVLQKSCESNTEYECTLKDLKDCMEEIEYTVLILKTVNKLTFNEIAEYLEISIDKCKRLYKSAFSIAKQVLVE